jgi:SagB-type dehydrogenase family enzyme
MTAAALFLSLDPLAVVTRTGGRVEFRTAARSLTLSALSDGTLSALARLAGDGASEDELTELVARSDGVGALADFYDVVALLGRERLLRLSARHDGTALLTLVPTSRRFAVRYREPAPDGRYVLSRFVLLRVDQGTMVLESPRADCVALLHDPRVVSLLHGLARPRSVREIGPLPAALPEDVTRRIMALLLEAGMLVPCAGSSAAPAAADSTDEAAAGLADEDEEQDDLQVWEHHDLLFHTRSRSGGWGAPLGSTYRFAGVLPPPPARRPTSGLRAQTALFRPDLDELRRHDPPFARVLDARRSIRGYAATPLTVRQLGEFLFRAGRVRRRVEAAVETPRGPVPMDFAWRPYPGGGALYELELYPVVRCCEGLKAGLYHYEPHGHLLERLGGEEVTKDLLAEAGHAAGIPEERLQVLIVVAARFPRVFWKYSGIGYATILKDVGCLYQTMYLVATAMALAPCAVGAGDPGTFAAASGIARFREGSVGEFLLGSAGRPPDAAGGAPGGVPGAPEARRPAHHGATSAAAPYEPLRPSATQERLAMFRRMREEDPVYWHPGLRVWFLTRYDDIAAMARDPRYTSTRERRDGADAPPALRERLGVVEGFLSRWLPLNDPPQHGALRRAAAALFEPPGIDRLRSFVERVVARCLDERRGEGGVDVINDLGFPLATAVIARLLGVPATDIPRLKAWIKDVTALVSARRATDASVAVSFRGVTGLQEYFRQRPGTRRQPRGCGPGEILPRAAGGAHCSAVDVAALAAVLLMGGYETVAYQIGNAVLGLLEQPEALRLLRARPELLPITTEECVRYDASVLQMMRRVREDVELHGRRVPARAIVLGLIHAGNHDPAQFGDPDRLIADRRPNRHLGFGFGAHSCLGAMLARLQTQAALAALLDRFPALALAGSHVERVQSFTFHGLQSLPVLLREQR